MANIRAIDIDEQLVWLKAEGEGTELDPHVSVFTVDEDTVIKTEVTNATLTVDTQLTQGLTNQQLLDANVDVTVTNLPATQAISAAELPLPSGAATSANQTTMIGHIDGVESLIAGLTPLTDVQLRANPVATSVSSLPLPTGAATGANQQRIPGLDIPRHDTVVVTEDSAGKLSTVAYSLAGAPVATLGFTYSGYTFVEPYRTTTIVRS